MKTLKITNNIKSIDVIDFLDKELKYKDEDDISRVFVKSDLKIISSKVKNRYLYGYESEEFKKFKRFYKDKNVDVTDILNFFDFLIDIKGFIK